MSVQWEQGKPGPLWLPSTSRANHRGVGFPSGPNLLWAKHGSCAPVSDRSPRPWTKGAERIERLLRPLVGLSLPSLSGPTVRKSRLCLLDALGNMVAASRFPEALAVDRASGPLSHGSATVFGWPGSTAPRRAAFHNAVHLDLLEAQDGHRRAGLHPCEAAIPVALAVGESHGNSVGELLAGIVAGYEVAVRFGEALFPGQTQAGYYPDGTCGPLGGAMAGSRLFGSDLSITERAISTAAFAAPISLVQTMRSPAKPLIAGMAAELGLRAAVWAREGLGGGPESFEPPHGFLEQLSPRPLPRRLERMPRAPWAIDEVYLKPYPGGRHAHAPLDAALRITGARPTDPRTIRSVDVRTYRAALALTGSMPQAGSPLAELTQSTRYVIAAGIRDGALGPERFRPGRRFDPLVLALGRRVRLREDVAATRRYPRTTTAEVTIAFRDGRSMRSTVRHRWGDPERPMTVEEVRAKFLRSVAGRFSVATATRTWDRWWTARPGEPVAALVAELSDAVGSVRRERAVRSGRRSTGRG